MGPAVALVSAPSTTPSLKMMPAMVVPVFLALFGLKPCQHALVSWQMEDWPTNLSCQGRVSANGPAQAPILPERRCPLAPPKKRCACTDRSRNPRLEHPPPSFLPPDAPARVIEPVRALTASTFRCPASVEKLAASATLEPCDVTPCHLPRSSTDSCAPPQQAFIPRAAAHAPCTPNPRTTPHTSTTLPAAYLWRAARSEEDTWRLCRARPGLEGARSILGDVGSLGPKSLGIGPGRTLLKRLTMADPAESLQQFMDTTGADAHVAKFFMER